MQKITANRNKNHNTKRLGAEVSAGSHPFTVRAIQKVSNTYIVDVWDVLENLTDVEDALFAMSVAEEHDQVVVNLNCDGGSLYVGDALLMAMNNCAAPVHVVASGRVASFATFVLLNADSFEISPYIEILCHSASFGSVGKMQDTLQHSEFIYTQAKKLLHEEYKHFLTEAEINRIIEDKYEHYMTAEEFSARFEKRNECMMKEIAAQMENNPPETLI